MGAGARIAMSINAHRLMAWLSPSFPTGAFAYSHGLEQAIAVGQVHDRASLCDWLTTVLERGSFWNDALLFAATLQAPQDGEQMGELAEALAGSRERYLETMAQGAAFARCAAALLPKPISATALPVVVALACAEAEITVPEALPLFLHAQTANLVSVAVRLVPLGQTDGQRALQELFPIFDQVSERALAMGLEGLGSAAWGSDLAAMKHENMQTRIFRT